MVTRVYGSTEVPVTTVGSLDDAEHAADTDGRAGIADIKLVAHDAAPPGRRDPCARTADAGRLPASRGRDRDLSTTKATSAPAISARWVDDDYLVVTGRAKDIIIRNGENISPKEIEDILVGHPDIAEIAIVGLPDARTGERACAVIVPTAQPGPDVDEPARASSTTHGVAKFKVPEQVVIWDALPKNDAGKVLKHQIRATLTKADG